MRQAFTEGGSYKAGVLARRYAQKGALKRTDAGSQLKVLGGGVEGPATLTVGSTAAGGGVTVRKQLDPTGFLYSPEIAKRKLEVGKALRNDRRFAKLYSDDLKTSGGSPYLHYEYTPGKSGEAALQDQRARLQAAVKEREFFSAQRPEGLVGKAAQKFRRNMRNALGNLKVRGRVNDVLDTERRLGALENASRKYKLTDIRNNPGNWKMTARGPVAIDYLPLTTPEIQRRSRAYLDAGGPLGGMDAVRAGWNAAGPFNATGDIRNADIKGTLQRLGSGSRQAKKVRGAVGPEVPLTERIQNLRKRYGGSD